MSAKKAALGTAAACLLLAGAWLAHELTPAPRDPTQVYQSGSAVGKVIGAKEDNARGTVYFQQIRTGGLFDQFQDFEYQGYVLHIANEEMVGTTRVAGKTFENFIHVTTKITGKRS